MPADAEPGVQGEDHESRDGGDLPHAHGPTEARAKLRARDGGRGTHGTPIGVWLDLHEVFVAIRPTQASAPRLNPGSTDADRASMVMTSPLLRVAIVMALTAFMAALMLVRVGSGERQGPATSLITPVSLAGHTPGSTAHDRHEYRLRLAAAAASSER